MTCSKINESKKRLFNLVTRDSSLACMAHTTNGLSSAGGEIPFQLSFYRLMEQNGQSYY